MVIKITDFSISYNNQKLIHHIFCFDDIVLDVYFMIKAR